MKRIRLLNLYIISILILFSNSCTNSRQEASEIASNTGDEKIANTRSTLSDFYYISGEKQYLEALSDKQFVLFQESPIELQAHQKRRLASTPMAEEISPLNMSESTFNDSNRSWAIAQATERSTKNMNVVYSAPVYRNKEGKELALSHLFYVKLKIIEDVPKLQLIEQRFRVRLLGQNPFMELWFTFECTEHSLGNSLDISNKVYESGEFAEAYPDLINLQSDAFCVNDLRFPEQWHLANYDFGLNLCGVRKVTSGESSVIVAVLDQGVELDHPDLNLHSVSYDTERGISPSRIYGGHGTLCAGFISAKTDNVIGIASLAPDCKVMSISNTLLKSLDSSQKRANGINFAWQNGASVISNSWGAEYRSPMINDAIDNALSKGRQGKGTVVVFATGNNKSGYISYPSSIGGDGFIAVGATNSSGKRANFSQYGDGLDVVAPGDSVLSTWLNGKYLEKSGTSFATPLVAATAALLISVDPSLSAKQVEAVICENTTKLPTYLFSSKKRFGTWNKEVGYGLLNPLKALNSVKNNPPNANCVIRIHHKTISEYTYLEGCEIDAGNFVVKPRASLIFRADGDILLNSPFTVEYGATFTMMH